MSSDHLAGMPAVIRRALGGRRAVFCGHGADFPDAAWCIETKGKKPWTDSRQLYVVEGYEVPNTWGIMRREYLADESSVDKGADGSKEIYYGTAAEAAKELKELLMQRGSRRGNPSRSHLGASVWSRELHGSAATAFSNLKPGDQFRFPGASALLTKVNATRYVDAIGRNFTTGRHAAVIPMRDAGASRENPSRRTRDRWSRR